jgi:hypothetical protein
LLAVPLNHHTETALEELLIFIRMELVL